MRPNPGIDEVFARAEIERRAHEWSPDHPGCSVTILRPCTVVVPGAEDWPSADFDGIAGLGSGDGTRPVQFLHVEDLAGCRGGRARQRDQRGAQRRPRRLDHRRRSAGALGGRVVALPEPVRRAARRLRLGKTVDRGAAALTPAPMGGRQRRVAFRRLVTGLRQPRGARGHAPPDLVPAPVTDAPSGTVDGRHRWRWPRGSRRGRRRHRPPPLPLTANL